VFAFTFTAAAQVPAAVIIVLLGGLRHRTDFDLCPASRVRAKRLDTRAMQRPLGR
jgi:hypothetical protein